MNLTLFFAILSVCLIVCLGLLILYMVVLRKTHYHSGSYLGLSLHPGFIFEHSAEAILISDDSLQVLTANRAAKELLDSNALTGRSFPAMFTADSRRLLMKHLSGYEASVYLRALELTSGKSVSCSFSRSVSRKDRRAVYIFYLHDVTDLKDAISKLDQLANYDVLTGLCNRHSFGIQLDQWVQRYQKTGQDFVLFFMDLTNFKYINDTYGHSAGDAALKAVADALRQTIDPGDALGRFSGDEFVILHPAETREPMFSKIRKTLNDIDCSSFAPGFRMDAGIGHCLYSEAKGVESLYQTADLRMYNNKSLCREISGVTALRETFSESTTSNVLDNDLFNAFSGASNHVYIYMCDMRTDMSRWSRNAVEYFGLPGEYIENAGEIWTQRVHPDDQTHYQALMEGIMSGKLMIHRAEYRARNTRGDYVWLQCRGRTLLDPGGNPRIFAGMLTRLDARNKYDPLTRLKTINEFNLYDFSQGSGTIMLLGLDKFRSVVNTYGYGFGDTVLQQLAQRTTDSFGANHDIYRMEGDEFLIISPDSTPEQANTLFRQLRQQAVDLGDEDTTVTLGFSAGCVAYPQDGTTRETLLRNLEHSLQFAKQTNQGGLCFFSQEIALLHDRQMEQRSLITQSIQNDLKHFSIHYQPLVSTDDHRIIGCEALLRWSDPGGTSIPTDAMINLLESDRGINIVGKWVANAVMAQASVWHQRYGDLMVGFNTSYLQFRTPHFAETLIQLAQMNQVDPNYIVIELTESCAVEQVSELAASFRRLREFGFNISLDDFGIGYSTLLSLRELPVDSVKVDHTFVCNLTSANTTDLAIVRSVTTLAHDLGLRVVLEGVENETVLELIAPFQATYYQGYYFAKPMPPEEFEKLMEQGGFCTHQ